LIEQNDLAGIAAYENVETIMSGAATYLPGAEIPNLILLPVDSKIDFIMANSITVQAPTALSDLLVPGMGAMRWAACLKAITQAF